MTFAFSLSLGGTRTELVLPNVDDGSDADEAGGSDLEAQVEVLGRLPQHHALPAGKNKSR